MTVQLYEILSVVSFIMAGILLVVAIVLFIRFQIPKVLGDLTGTTERRAVETMNRYNREGVQVDAKLPRQHHTFQGITEKIVTEKIVGGMNSNGAETTLLGEETTVLPSFLIQERVLYIHTEERII